MSAVFNVRDYGAKGSGFTTSCRTVAGSDVVTVDKVGCIEVGDEIVIRRGFIQTPIERMFVRKDTSSVNPRPYREPYVMSGELELSGYDGSEGDWAVYFIDMYPEAPDEFRWSNDFGRTWHTLPVSDDKIHLTGDMYLKINDFEDKQYGITAALVRTSRLFATVLEVDGNKLRISERANITAESELLLGDSVGIQRAVDAAMKVSGTVFIPSGRYRLTSPISIIDAEGLTVEGENAASTVIDNSLEGTRGPNYHRIGRCFLVKGSKEVTIKNLSMEGHMGYDKRDQAGRILSLGAPDAYGFYYSSASAVNVEGTERVLIENCHARKMSAECFYARSFDLRTSDYEPKLYPKSLTFLRCSVEDCARNAFNNNDTAENTSVLYCRIRNVGGCAWEGSSRFVKIIGNYIRNAGPVACGNLRRRDGEVEKLGTAQHVIADNIFEEGINYGSAAITVSAGASQCIIKNNTFVNFNSSAINIVGTTQHKDLPVEHITVSGNHIDLTAEGAEPVERFGINASANYVTVSDNHVYVRGVSPDSLATGIITSDAAVNVNIHDNTVSACSAGILITEGEGCVGEVVDSTHFYRMEPGNFLPGKPALPRRRSHCYRGWRTLWSDGTESTIDYCDPDSRIFTLREGRALKSGDTFRIYNPLGRGVLIHSNAVTSCDRAIAADSLSRKLTVIRDNLTDCE